MISVISQWGNEARIVLGLLRAEQLGRAGDLMAESAMRLRTEHIPAA